MNLTHLSKSRRIFTFNSFLVLIFLILIASFYSSIINNFETNFNDESSKLDGELKSESLFNKNMTNGYFQKELSNLDAALLSESIVDIKYAAGLDFKIQTFPVKTDFQLVFSHNLEDLFDQGLNSGMLIEEGHVPNATTDLLMDVRFKQLGYNLNDSIQLTVSQKQLNPTGKNYTCKITGFFTIQDDHLLRIINSWNLKYQYSPFLGINSEHDVEQENELLYLSNFVCFSTGTWGDLLYSQYQSQKLFDIQGTPENYGETFVDIPIYSKVLILSDNNTSFTLNQIERNTKIIQQWILVNSEYKLSLSDRCAYGIFVNNIDTINDMKLDIFLLSVPLIFIFWMLNKRYTDIYLGEISSKIEILYHYGLSKKKILRIIVKSSILQNSIISTGLILLYLLIIYFLPHGWFIFAFTIIPVLVFITLMGVSFQISLIIEFSKKFELIIENKFHDINIDFEFLDIIEKQRRRKQRRRLIISFIFLLIPITLSLLSYFVYSYSLKIEFIDNILENLGQMFIFFILLFSIPILYLIPYVVAKLITPLIRRMHNGIFSFFAASENKNHTQIFKNIIKKDPALSNEIMMILLIIFSFLSPLTNLYLFRVTTEENRTAIDWDSSNIHLEFSLQNSTQMRNFQFMQNPSNYLPFENSEISNRNVINSYKILFDTSTTVDLSSLDITRNSLLYKIGYEFGVQIIFNSSFLGEFEKGMISDLFINKYSVIISSSFAHAANLNVGDNFSLIDNFNSIIQPVQVIGILDNLPLTNLNVNDKNISPITEILFGFTEYSATLIQNVEIYAKTGENNAYNTLVKGILDNYSTNSKFIFTNIEEKHDSNNINSQFFIEKFAQNQIWCFSLLVFNFVFITYQLVSRYRKKVDENLEEYGLDQQKITKFLNIEIISYLISISIVGTLMFYIIGEFFSSIFQLFANFNFYSTPIKSFSGFVEKVQIIQGGYYRTSYIQNKFQFNWIGLILIPVQLISFLLVVLIEKKGQENNNGRTITAE